MAGLRNQSNGTMTVTDSTISGNSAVMSGGGLSQNFGASITTSVTNSTFSNNFAANGGGVQVIDGSLDLLNVTIANNRATTSGGGIDRTGGTITVTNTLVGNNVSPTGPDGDGTIATANNSLFSNDTDLTIGGGVGNLFNVNPLLGELQDNGGPTLTHALLRNSPAINAGDNTPVVELFDQRGDPFDRIVDMIVDIGAYEARVDTLSIVQNGSNVTITGDANGNILSIIETSTPGQYTFDSDNLSTINGQPVTSITFSNVTSITANLDAGNDILTLQGNSTANTQLNGPLTINNQGGLNLFDENGFFNVNGELQLNHSSSDPLNVTLDDTNNSFFRFVVNNGSSDDTINLTDQTITSLLSLSLGDGANTTNLTRTTAGNLVFMGGMDIDSVTLDNSTSNSNLTFMGGDGANTITVQNNTTINGNTAIGSSTQELSTVTLTDSSFQGTLTINSGGNDPTETLNVTMTNTLAANATQFFGSAQDDTININNAMFNNRLTTTLGNGQNDLSIQNTTVQGVYMNSAGGHKLGNVDIDGSTFGTTFAIRGDSNSGTDVLNVDIADTTIGGQFTIIGGLANDIINLSNMTVNGPTYIQTSGGNDTVRLENSNDSTPSNYQGRVDILMSTGDDTLQVSLDLDDNAIFAAFANFNGGAGIDTSDGQVPESVFSGGRSTVGFETSN